jgi:hypothetical protein
VSSVQPGGKQLKEILAEASSQEYKVDVRWSPACKNVSPEAEECLLLEAATKQRDRMLVSV